MFCSVQNLLGSHHSLTHPGLWDTQVMGIYHEQSSETPCMWVAVIPVFCSLYSTNSNREQTLFSPMYKANGHLCLDDPPHNRGCPKEGLRGLAQVVCCLLCNNEDLSSDLQHPCKSWVQFCACNTQHCRSRARQVDPGCSLVN